jgi:hypothetical protein
VLAALALQDVHGKVVEPNVKIIAIPGVFAMNPGSPARGIKLRPAQAGHLALPKARSQREQHHIALLLGEFCQQGRCLLRRDPGHRPLRFPIKLDLRRLLDPFPLVGGLAQDRADGEALRS